MSWDAWLSCECCGMAIIERNYTHNCNRMANAALDAAGYDRPTEHLRDGTVRTVSWWKVLDGMTGPDGGALLTTILAQFNKDPNRYRAMNPENGWGDFDSFREVLIELHDRIPETPTTWSVHG